MSWAGRVIVALTLVVLAPASSFAAEGDDSKSGSAAEQRSTAGEYFTDVLLVNQDGVEMRLFSDLLRGRVVIMSSFFSSCVGVCTVTTATMRRIQDWLGERLGRDVFLLSLTVDPENDTPERLKEYAEKFGARPGWFFLTGKRENVDFALYKFGQRVARKEDHKAIFIVGNEPTGLWKKAMALSPIDDLIEVVRSVVDDSGE